MISEVVITIFIIISLTLTYLMFVVPKKQIKNYTKAFKENGYKVLELPFNPFTNSVAMAIKKGIGLGDALKIQKEVHINYDVVVSNVLWKPRIEISNPALIKEFYAVDKHYEYPKLERVVDIFSRVGGKGLPFAEGEVWKRKRNVMNKVFNFDFVKAQCNKIADICDQSMEQIEANKVKENNEVSYNILDLTVQIFSNVMMASFLGGTHQEYINGEPAGNFIKKLMSDIHIQSLDTFNFMMGPKFLNLGITSSQRDINNRIIIYQKWGKNFIQNRIKEVNEELSSENKATTSLDIIKALIISNKNARMNNGGDDEAIINESEIFDEFSAFFVAGTDTTSNFVQMMIYQIAKYPKIEAKVREEIFKYMQTDDYSYENLKNFKYIENLQKEVTRHFGPGTSLFPRIAGVDNYLGKIPIKKDTALQIGVLTNHFKEEYFKNAKEFKPERWDSECDKLESFVFQGFSAGARTCIGKHLVMIESKIALIKFMKRYSKIRLGKSEFKMTFHFLYSPEDFDSTMTIKQNN